MLSLTHRAETRLGCCQQNHQLSTENKKKSPSKKLVLANSSEKGESGTWIERIEKFKMIYDINSDFSSAETVSSVMNPSPHRWIQEKPTTLCVSNSLFQISSEKNIFLPSVFPGRTGGHFVAVSRHCFDQSSIPQRFSSKICDPPPPPPATLTPYGLHVYNWHFCQDFPVSFLSRCSLVNHESSC